MKLRLAWRAELVAVPDELLANAGRDHGGTVVHQLPVAERDGRDVLMCLVSGSGAA